MRAYAHQAKNKELEIDAAEIRLRAERRLGELIDEQDAAGLLHHGSRGIGKSGVVNGDSTPTYKDVGISKGLGARARKLSAIPESEFEGMLGEWRERVAQEGERVTTRLLNAGEQHRREAANSATPPPNRCQHSYESTHASSRLTAAFRCVFVHHFLSPSTLTIREGGPATPLRRGGNP